MICSTCSSEFSGQRHNEVRLSIVCGECITSTNLVTKTAALGMGATHASLDEVHCLYKRNPLYRNGADMRLFVVEEIRVLASIAADKKRRFQEQATRKKEAADAKQQLAKRSRIESLAKRTRGLGGIVPTPGLVCGDFLSVDTRTPKVGARSLLQRRDMWARLAATEIPVAVQVFQWAVRNKKTGVEVATALDEIRHEKHLFDRVATVEGYGVLSFLDDAERLVLLRASPVFEEARYDLPVRDVPDRLCCLCEEIAKHLNLPFPTVLRKLDRSGKCWISKYLYVFAPERVASIMAPHFLGDAGRRRVLKRNMDESFSRWGLCPAENTGRADFFVHYFRGDIVDVEFYSAACYILKAGVSYYPRGADAVSSRVVSTPGTTWMEAAKQYVREQLVIKQRETVRMQSRTRERNERYHMQKHDQFRNCDMFACGCGNASARECPFDLCAGCCEGPCDRHGIY